MSTTAVSVVVIDGDEDVATLVEAMVEANDRFRLVGTARTGTEGFALTAAAQPDAVLLDLELPGVDALTVLPMLRRACTGVIVAFSEFPDPATLVTATARGADVYLDKGRLWAELLPSIEAARATLAAEARAEDASAS